MELVAKLTGERAEKRMLIGENLDCRPATSANVEQSLNVMSPDTVVSPCRRAP